MRLDEDMKERLRTLTVEVLLDARAAYLAGGANPLSHWDQLQARARSAARTSTCPEEWITGIRRRLALKEAPTLAGSRSARELADRVRDGRCAREWLDLVEAEHGYLIAVAQGIAEERRIKGGTDG